MGTRFHFTAQDRETYDKYLSGSGKILNVNGRERHWEVLYLGKLMTLFGEPLYTSEDLEDQIGRAHV